jgi:hypothetical protein
VQQGRDSSTTTVSTKRGGQIGERVELLHPAWTKTKNFSWCANSSVAKRYARHVSLYRLNCYAETEVKANMTDSGRAALSNLVPDQGRRQTGG